jgi:hypothetical protein
MATTPPAALSALAPLLGVGGRDELAERLADPARDDDLDVPDEM